MNARQAPREYVRQACARYGSADVVRRCAALLRGADPAGEEEFLRTLGFRGELSWLLKEPNPYWARVWAARALRYCWDDTAAAAVLHGLYDEAWRVVEHCAVIAGDRELADAVPTLVTLTEDPGPRVRAAAARAMASVAEREHLPTLLRLTDDPERIVRVATEKALAALRDRLDLNPEELTHHDH
ncbi:HEAT repeat-containing protein [Actinopolymorpha cephalotaxi]|uniref:HEAT repeat protein n=1 Tax=Actinopolymorpha cephalotaxi TaxID=504797 RepID=A0A1I2N6A3_9ACTN|nr:HEAT repeat domain-containing protein [Actinopolymorpha cephalotaxi]NYH85699.1 HEAT repeat protein [Actinopolymorpha cephalotaxi]SFF98369.1 HEAT repeat-containing protein [Actinopolymorpha cephalotaxi]